VDGGSGVGQCPAYQASDPQVHVILLFGHARGVAEQLLDPLGNPDPSGLQPANRPGRWTSAT
jgi:hypothetical protein